MCYQTTTDDLPGMFKSSRAITDGGNEATDSGFLLVNGLTHLNYAFAFIDLTTFKITTMDTATPVRTFTRLCRPESQEPSFRALYEYWELFVSIGGCLSDNETATQPIFKRIALSAANRQTFANNVL